MSRMQKTKRKNSRAGLTLTEVMVVLVVIAVLAAVAIPSMIGFIRHGQQVNRMNVARTLYVAMQGQLTRAVSEGNLRAVLTEGFYELDATGSLDLVEGDDYFKLEEDDGSPYWGLVSHSDRLGDWCCLTDDDDNEVCRECKNKPYVFFISKPAAGRYSYGDIISGDPVATRLLASFYRLLDEIIIDKEILDGAILMEFNIRTGVIMSIFYGDDERLWVLPGSRTVNNRHFAYGIVNENDRDNILGGRGMDVYPSLARERRQGYFGVTYTSVVPPLPIDDIVRIFDGMDYYLNVGTPTAPDRRTNILYAEFLLLNELTDDDDDERSLVIYDDSNGEELNGLRIDNPFAQSQQNLNNFNGALIHSQTPGPDGIVNHALYLDTVNTIPIIQFGINVRGVFSRYIWVLDYIEDNLFEGQPNNIGYKYDIRHDSQTPRLRNDPLSPEMRAPMNLRARVVSADGASTESFMFANSHFAANLTNDTFQITSVRHLNNVRYFPNENFVQTDDIDVSTLVPPPPGGSHPPDEPPTWNFVPIGLLPDGTSDPFTGTYNAVRGADSQWRIKNLNINTSPSGPLVPVGLPTYFPVPDYVGLFSEIGSVADGGGTVVGVSLVGATITAPNATNVGAIAGVMRGNSTISRSNVFANVVGRDSGTGSIGNTGGLVGRIEEGGTLSHSFNAGFYNTYANPPAVWPTAVHTEHISRTDEPGRFGSVTAGAGNIGGLVGENRGTIQFCFNNARVNIFSVIIDTDNDPYYLSRNPVPTLLQPGATARLGGIAGNNTDTGMISSSYATNHVAVYPHTPNVDSGGIAGRNEVANRICEFSRFINHSNIPDIGSGVITPERRGVGKDELMEMDTGSTSFIPDGDRQTGYLTDGGGLPRNFYENYPYPLLSNNMPFMNTAGLSWGWEDIEESEFEEVALLYFERYDNGTYGFYPPNIIQGLRPLQDNRPIHQAGYMLVTSYPLYPSVTELQLFIRPGTTDADDPWTILNRYPFTPVPLVFEHNIPEGMATPGSQLSFLILDLGVLETRLGNDPNIPLQFVVTFENIIDAPVTDEIIYEDEGYFHPFFAKAISDTPDFTRAVSEISEIDDDEIRTYQIRTPWQMQNIDKVSTGTPFRPGTPDSVGVTEINGLFYNDNHITINPAVNIRVTPTLPGRGVLDPVVETYLSATVSATERGWVFPPGGGNAIPPNHNPATYANMGVIGNPHTWAIVDYLGSAVARVIPSAPSTRVEEIRTASLLGDRLLTVNPGAENTTTTISSVIGADGFNNITVTGGGTIGASSETRNVNRIFITGGHGSVILEGDFTGINIHNTNNWAGTSFTLGAPGEPFSTGTGVAPGARTNIYSISPINIHLADNSTIRNARIAADHQYIAFGPETVSSGVILDASFYAGSITGHINVSGWNPNTLPQFYSFGWEGINLTMTGSSVMSGVFFTGGTIVLNLPVGTGPGTDPVPAVSTMQFLQDRNISIRYDRGPGNTAGDGTTATTSDIGGIITLTNNAVVAETFCGIYDGQGHIIEHLIINQTSPRCGLFAENHGTIGRLQLRNTNIIGGSNVGSIAGINSGEILRTAVEFSTVSGGSSSEHTIGGIAGTNTETGRIEDVYFLSTAALNTPPVSNNGGGIVGHNSGEINKVLYLAPAPRTGNEMFPIVRSGTGVPTGQDATSFYLSGFRHSLNQGINWINVNYNLSSAELEPRNGGRPLITDFIDLEWLNFNYTANFSHEFWHQPARGYPYPALRGMSIPTGWPQADSPVRPDQLNRQPFGTFPPPFGSLAEPSIFRPTVNRAGNVGFINSDFRMDMMNPANPSDTLGILNPSGQGGWAERIPPRIFRPDNPAYIGDVDHEQQYGYTFAYYDHRWMQGWNTRPIDPDGPNGYTNPLWHAIELQRPCADSLGNFGLTITDFQGGPDGIFAELNAEVPGTLFQICQTVPGTQVYYSFYHARRNHGPSTLTAPGIAGWQRMNFYLSGMTNVDGEWVYSDPDGNPLPYPYNRPTIIRPCITPRGTALSQTNTRNTVVYGTTANDDAETVSPAQVYFYDPSTGDIRNAYLIDIWVGIPATSGAAPNTSLTGNGFGITFWTDLLPPALPLGGISSIDQLPTDVLRRDAQNNIIGYWDVRRFNEYTGDAAEFSEWKQYYGLFTIPQGQYTTEFAFESGSQRHADSGNYLSGVTFRSPGFLSIDKYVTLGNRDVMFVQPGNTLTFELAVKNWGEVAVNNIVITDQLAPYDAYIEFLANTIVVERVDGDVIDEIPIPASNIVLPTPGNQQTLSINLPQDISLERDQELLIRFNIRVRDNVSPGVSTLLYYFRNEARITWFDAEHRGYSFNNTLPYNNIPLGQRDRNREVNVSGPEPVQVFIDPIHLDKTIESADGDYPFRDGFRPGDQPFDVTLRVRNATDPRLPITTRGIITDVIPAGFDIVDISESGLPANHVINNNSGLPANYVITNNLDGSRRITIPNVNLDENDPFVSFTYRLQYTGQGFGVISTSISSEYRYIYFNENNPGDGELSVMMRFPQRVVTVTPKTEADDDFIAYIDRVQTFNILENDWLSQQYADENYDINMEVILYDLAGNPAQVNANGDLQITDAERGIVIILLASTNEVVFNPLIHSEITEPGPFEFDYQVIVTATRPGSETFILESDMTRVTIDVREGGTQGVSIALDGLETDEFDGDLSDTSHDGDEPGNDETNGRTTENGNNNNGDSRAPGSNGRGDDPASALTPDGEVSDATPSASGASHDGFGGGDILIATSFALGGGYGISRVKKFKTLIRKLDARAVRRINEHNERRRMRER